MLMPCNWVDRFGCACPPDSCPRSAFDVYLCSCIIILCYFTGIFHAVVSQISMLFIDNKDSVSSHLLHVDFKRTEGLTLWAGARLGLCALRLVEGAQDEAALVTVVLDNGQLRHDARHTGHHTIGADQLVQVQLPEKEELTLTNRCSHLLLGSIFPISRTPETKSETSWRPPLLALSVCHPQMVRERIHAHMSQRQKVRTPHVTFLPVCFQKIKTSFSKQTKKNRNVSSSLYNKDI